MRAAWEVSEVIVEGEGVHAVAGQPSHDSCLLVVAHALLEEVGLAPADRPSSLSDPHLVAQTS